MVDAARGSVNPKPDRDVCGGSHQSAAGGMCLTEKFELVIPRPNVGCRDTIQLADQCFPSAAAIDIAVLAAAES